MKIDRVFSWVVVVCTMFNIAGLAYEIGKPRPPTMTRWELAESFVVAMSVIDADPSDPETHEKIESICWVTGCLPWNVHTVLEQIRPLLRR